MSNGVESFRERMNNMPYDANRTDLDKVMNELKKLGVSENSEFSQYISKFCMPFIPGRSNRGSLGEVSNPAYDLRRATVFAQESWGLSSGYVVLSQAVEDRFYAFSCETEEVYQLTCENVDDLNSGRLTPQWGGFFEFLEWYLSP